MLIGNSLKKVVRRAVLCYSIRNRHAKARAISEWMSEHDCKTMLFVGALGRESGDSNIGIVERELSQSRTVKMAINIVSVDTDYPFLIADGRAMPFEDGYVDFALANAIIEHVGDESDQRRFVAEQTRVARCWVITTPNRWFPVESHTSTMFLHWLPGWRSKRDEFTRLLSRRELKAILPEDAAMTAHWWSPTFTAYFSSDGRGSSPVAMETTVPADN
jgi:hypothetical protein